MLVKITVFVEYIATRIEMWVTTSPSRFLHIILQRVGYVIMYDQSNIFLVNPHSEGRCGNNDTNLVVHEVVLIGNLLFGFHLTIEGQCLEAIAGQFGRQLFSSLGS